MPQILQPRDQTLISDNAIHEFDSQLRDLLRVQTPQAPLNPEIESSEEIEGGIKRMLVRYNVDDGERIGAYLLVPKGEPGVRLPGILAIHQHGGNFKLGKSEPAGLTDNPTFFYGLDLARRGFAVLCPDMLAFEERVPPPEVSAGDMYKLDSWNERFEAMKLFLQGSSMQAKYLSDLVKGLDYLTSLDFVDSERIGCIGHSMGGQEALWLTWFDPRIKAAVSSCGFSMISAILRDRINHNMALYVPGMMNVGDMDSMVASLAPRPFFFSAGEEDDIFPVDSVRHIAEAAGEVYARRGAPENLQHVIFGGGHGFPDEVKQQAYSFLETHLKP